MTTEIKIERLARAYGLVFAGSGDWHNFAVAVADAERARCAAIARHWGATHEPGITVNARNAGDKIARGIERSNVRGNAHLTAAQEVEDGRD